MARRNTENPAAITQTMMRSMNQAVDAGRQDPAAVARAFLARLERDRQSKG